MTHWIKLYTEILHDPKMGKMSDHLWRRCIEIFLLAGELGADGALPTEEDMAYVLRCKPSELAVDIAKLSGLGIVELVDNKWVVTKFSKRQAPSDAAIRMRNYRERLRNSDSNVRDDEINQSHIQNQIHIQNQNQKQNHKHSIEESDDNIFKLYAENISELTPVVSEKLKLDEDEFGSEKVKDAIKKAVFYNKRSIGYIEAILKNNGKTKDERDRERYGEWDTPHNR